MIQHFFAPKHNTLYVNPIKNNTRRAMGLAAAMAWSFALGVVVGSLLTLAWGAW